MNQIPDSLRDKVQEEAERLSKIAIPNDEDNLTIRRECWEDGYMSYFTRNIENSLLEGEQGGWISVNDRLPEYNVGVLVFIPEEDHHITSGMWDVSNKWVLLDEYRKPECEVTHWMKLVDIPDEYKSERDENNKVMKWLKEVNPELITVKYFIENINTNEWFGNNALQFSEANKPLPNLSGDTWTKDPLEAMSFNFPHEADQYMHNHNLNYPRFKVTEHEFVPPPPVQPPSQTEPDKEVIEVNNDGYVEPSKEVRVVDSGEWKDLQDRVKEHISDYKHFDWHEGLTENEMEYLVDLLLTFRSQRSSTQPSSSSATTTVIHCPKCGENIVLEKPGRGDGVELLDECDEILVQFEDSAHGKIGKWITELRGKIQSFIQTKQGK